jgi:hypothetical protein
MLVKLQYSMQLNLENWNYTELYGLFWTLSIVLYVADKKYHNVSETGSVSVLRWMGQDKPTQLGPLGRASLNPKQAI